MSRNEWEQGEVVLPRDKWSAFRSEVISSWNMLQERKFEEARKLKECLDVALHGLRQSTRRKELEATLENIDTDWSAQDVDLWDIVPAIVVSQEAAKLKNPKRKDFPTMLLSRNCEIEFGDALIRLSNDSHSVFWQVHENNHAVEAARMHPMGRKLFELLGEVGWWPRGSGGVIYGNDEYNHGSEGPGAGANYVTSSYGIRKVHLNG